MPKIYQVTYVRDDKNADKFRKSGVPYSEGQSRILMCTADDEDEALAIAEKRLAEQYPDDDYEKAADGAKVRIAGSEFDGEHRPDLAHSNYKLQGVEVLEQEGA